MHSAGEMDPPFAGMTVRSGEGWALFLPPFQEGEKERGLLNPVGLYHRIQRA